MSGARRESKRDRAVRERTASWRAQAKYLNAFVAAASIANFVSSAEARDALRLGRRRRRLDEFQRHQFHLAIDCEQFAIGYAIASGVSVADLARVSGLRPAAVAFLAHRAADRRRRDREFASFAEQAQAFLEQHRRARNG